MSQNHHLSLPDKRNPSYLTYDIMRLTLFVCANQWTTYLPEALSRSFNGISTYDTIKSWYFVSRKRNPIQFCDVPRQTGSVKSSDPRESRLRPAVRESHHPSPARLYKPPSPQPIRLSEVLPQKDSLKLFTAPSSQQSRRFSFQEEKYCRIISGIT